MVGGDFIKTFSYGQGSRSLQRVYFTMVRDHYTALPESEQSQIEPALTVLQKYVGKFALPGYHSKRTSAQVRDEFELTFGEFKQCLTDPSYVPLIDTLRGPTPVTFADRPEQVIRYTINQEAQFMEAHSKAGRPLGNSPAETRDRHASFLREFVLNRVDARSGAFNAIFDQSRQTAVELYPHFPDPSSPFSDTTRFSDFTQQWEARHPEQQFFPPSFVAAVDASRQF